MGKFLFAMMFFFFVPLQAPDSLVANTKKTVSSISVDSASVTTVSYAKNFKRKYKSAEFVYEYKTPEKNAWDRFLEWLADVFKGLFHFTSDETAMNAVVIVLKVIAVIIVVFVIYLIVKALMNKEGRWIFGKNSDTKMIRYDEIEKNLHTANFEQLIHAALQNGENRLAIRYYYLWFLRRMSDRNIIEWDIEKTNSDYGYEIKNPALREQFAYLSYLYDYIWYGEFELDQHTLLKTKTAFEKAIKTVGND